MNNELQLVERSPKNEVAFGKEAAKALMDIVKEQRLSRKFGGEKEHIYVEGWELLGQFVGLSAGAEAEPVEIDGVKGAKGRAILRDKEGRIMGEAVAWCLRDEPNWKNKPLFQLMSMAQTRAVSKAFRLKLAWIAILAGYSGTPAEEMDDVPLAKPNPPQPAPKPAKDDLQSRKDSAIKWLAGKGKPVSACEDHLQSSYGSWNEKDLEELKSWAKQGFPETAPEADMPV